MRVLVKRALADRTPCCHCKVGISAHPVSWAAVWKSTPLQSGRKGSNSSDKSSLN